MYRDAQRARNPSSLKVLDEKQKAMKEDRR